MGGGATQLAQTAHADPASPHFRVKPRKASPSGGSDLTITPFTLAGVTFIDMDSKYYHSLAIDSKHNVYSWGDNTYGELGDGTTTSRLKPVPITFPTSANIVKVSTGYYPHSLALDDQGNLYTWGRNDKGQLGLGDTTNRNTPTKVTPPAGVNKFITATAAGDYCLAIGDDGKAYSWGNNNNSDELEHQGGGQLGVGDTTARTRPTAVVGIPATVKITSISALYMTSTALGNNGVIYTWGNNVHGQLANGNRYNSATALPVNPPAGQRWTSISTGGNFSTAIASNGSTYAWGASQWGTFGDGSGSNNTPFGDMLSPIVISRRMPAGVSIESMAQGGWHAIAIGSDKKTYSWGQNAWGGLGLAGAVVGFQSWSNAPYPVSVPQGITFIKVFSGYWNSYAIGNDGNLYGWGQNQYGQLGDGTVVAYRDAPVRVGGAISIDKVTVGTTTATGTSNPTTYAWSGKVPAGTPGTTVDIKVDWSLVGLGAQPSETYQLYYLDLYTVQFKLGGAPGTAPPDQQVEEDSGKLLDWPTTPAWEHHWFTGWYTDTGEPWDFSQPVTSSMTLTAGWEKYAFKLYPAHSPSQGGVSLSVSAPVAPHTITYSSLSAGQDYTLAIGSDGNAYSWGSNQHGRLGSGSADRQAHPSPSRVHLPDTVRVLQVAAGSSHALALGSDHHVYAWGANAQGQVGDGTSTDQNTPIDLTNTARLPSTIMQLAAGDDYSLALTRDGHLYTWGSNQYGTLATTINAGTTNPNSLPTDVSAAGSLPTTIRSISAGSHHALAVSNEHHTYSWGANEYGQLGTSTSLGTDTAQPSPVDLTTVGALPATITQVTAGSTHSLALSQDQHTYSWGDNQHGQLGDGTTTSRSTPTDISAAGFLPSSISQLAAGEHTSIALSTSGHVHTWGINTSGQLGNNNTNVSQATRPLDITTINALPAMTHITAGRNHTSAITNSRQVYSWGANTAGQLGQGSSDTNQHSQPTQAQATQALTVTALTIGTTNTPDTPHWDTASNTWQATSPAGNPGQTTSTIHWKLGTYDQPNYLHPFTYHYTLPSAGTIPLQRISGSLALTLTLSASLAFTANMIHRRKRDNKAHILANQQH
ncbi:hypothetical protein KIMH_05990 [Bombiscardovia apis]|uniref:RCC1-like domain-containing protein n=1 Tax=Bombiscardovia apis TaxID=2932182 RepID=A0ABM8BC45_9BIFI|nr:InlB B-repeat-containing protein [Bombiscardovia apis]BDR54488.1 hypothetical protein KIMH_05990 [Bombiscardovia apis]